MLGAGAGWGTRENLPTIVIYLMTDPEAKEVYSETLRSEDIFLQGFMFAWSM